MKVYTHTKEQVIKQLQSDGVKGLSHADAAARLDTYGRNISFSIKPFSVFKTFLHQLREPLILLLAAAGTIIFFAGDAFDAFIIVGIILLNACIGTFQERRIAHMVDQLRTFGKQESTVVREGVPTAVDDELLVPGDILIMQEGDHIPADARIIEAYNLLVDESVLTGESELVLKMDTVFTEDLTLSEQQNMLFCGSHITSGYVRALVVATGLTTASRSLVPTMELFSHHMPLQKDLAFVLQFILWLIVFICVSLFIIGIVAGKPFPELLAALVALFMCVVPQGLPVIMTVILVSGASVMARHKIVAKRLQALEALGRAQVVIVDKTGTLTKNELMVTSLVAGPATYTVSGIGYDQDGQFFKDGVVVTKENHDQTLLTMLEAALLLDRSLVEYSPHKKQYSVRGSANEAALAVCARKYGLRLSEVQKKYTKLYEIPFSAAHQYHAGFYQEADKGILFVIGSPEALSRRLKEVDYTKQHALEKATHAGMRVLLVASRSFLVSDMPQKSSDYTQYFTGLVDQDLNQLGFFCIQDTVREGAADVIATMQQAGIQVVMATGDNVKTASYVARQAGILQPGYDVIEGTLLHTLSDSQVLSQLQTTAVYARVLPADKVRLVGLFQEKGKVVMVIGDGVNDVPALSLAQVSVAMGAAGSQLAKDAAHIILLDDAFENISEGIAYGRHIFYTFKRVILYFFTTNFAEVLVMLFALAGGFPVPLLASQILWLNLVTDGFLDTALALEPVEKNVMRSSWLSEEHALLTKGLAAQVVYIALLGASLSFGVFAWYVPLGLEKARTMAMVTLTCCQWVTALNCRSLELSLFSLSPFSNRWLGFALLGILVTQIGLLYIPFLQAIFKTVPLQSTDWYIVGGVAAVLWVAEEMRKLVKRVYKRVR